MTDKEQVDLEAAVIRKLFDLPAFRLERKKVMVFNTYVLNYLANNISRKKPGANTDLSNFQGIRKKVIVTLKMLPIKAWFCLLLSVFFPIISYFFIKQNQILPKLIGLGFIFAFFCAFYIFIIESQSIYQLVESTFNYLDKISKDIKIYVDNIYWINQKKQKIKIKEENIEYISNKIVKEFIDRELRRIDFNLKEIYFFPLIFAFLNSCVIVYFAGDIPITVTQELLSLTNLRDGFPIIHNFNLQTVWTLSFIFLVALARYLIIKGSQRYNDKLYQSLFLLSFDENNVIN